MDEWAANGYLICRSELTEPGSYKVSFLVSGEAGRSKPSNDVTYVDASENLYQYQAHAGKAMLPPCMLLFARRGRRKPCDHTLAR